MAETHVEEKRIVDDEGRVLFVETTRVLVDGGDVHVHSERRIERCPTCGSRLDKVSVVGRCWEPGCGRQVCANCGVKAACCGRTLCEDHRNMVVQSSGIVWACSEHAPALAARQQLVDSVLILNEKLKESEKRHAMELQSRDMRLKEVIAGAQGILSHRKQVHDENVDHARLRLEFAQMQLLQLRVLAPNAYRLMHDGQISLPSLKRR